MDSVDVGVSYPWILVRSFDNTILWWIYYRYNYRLNPNNTQCFLQRVISVLRITFILFREFKRINIIKYFIEENSTSKHQQHQSKADNMKRFLLFPSYIWPPVVTRMKNKADWEMKRMKQKCNFLENLKEKRRSRRTRKWTRRRGRSYLLWFLQHLLSRITCRGGAQNIIKLYAASAWAHSIT